MTKEILGYDRVPFPKGRIVYRGRSPRFAFDEIPRNRLDADATGKPIVGIDEEEPPRRNLMAIIGRIAAKCSAEEWAALQSNFSGLADIGAEGEGEDEDDPVIKEKFGASSPLTASDARLAADLLGSMRLPRTEADTGAVDSSALGTPAGAAKLLARFSVG